MPEASLAVASTGADLAAVRLLPRPRADVIHQTVPGGAVLLATREEVYFGLNEVGTLIWSELLAGPCTLSALCARLAERYPEVDAATLTQDIVELLEALQSARLVEPAVDACA